jgi:hypothetical protein
MPLQNDTLDLAPDCQCADCRHYDTETDSCPGFPDGIPDAILADEHDHTKPWPGDGGFRFDPIEVED